MLDSRARHPLFLCGRVLQQVTADAGVRGKEQKTRENKGRKKRGGMRKAGVREKGGRWRKGNRDGGGTVAAVPLPTPLRIGFLNNFSGERETG